MPIQDLLERIPRQQVQPLKSLIGNNVLTEDGLRYAVNAVDPFSDRKITAVGFPDNVSTPTVVFVDTQTTTLSAATLGITGNWDCHIATLPFTNAIRPGVTGFNPLDVSVARGTGNTGRTALVSEFNADAGQEFNLFNVCAVAAGLPTFIDSTDHTQLTWSAGLDSYGNMPARVVGLAFEVINTTADLYKQGSVVVYRQPCEDGVGNVCISDPFNALIGGTAQPWQTLPSQRFMQMFRFMPTDISDVQKLMLYGGARQWDAKEGCYCIGAMNSSDNPLLRQSNIDPLFIGPGATVNASGWWGSGWFGASAGHTNTSQVLNSFNETCAPNRIIPYDTVGAYFFGLSEQTSLTINVRAILEVAADLSDPKLMALAQPSNPYNAEAIQMVSSCMREQPAGVPYNENPFGEWFKGVVSDMVSQIPVVGPVAKPLAQAVLNKVVPATGPGFNPRAPAKPVKPVKKTSDKPKNKTKK